MPDKWDSACEQTFLEARRQAEALKHTWLGTEHVALAMLSMPSSMLAGKLRALKREPRVLYENILSDLKEVVAPEASDGLPLTPRMRQIVATADALAHDQQRTEIEEPHLLQALVEGGPGVFIRATLKWDVEPGALLRAPVQPSSAPTLKVMQATVVDGEVAAASPGEPGPPAPPAPSTPRSRLPKAGAQPPIPVPISHNPALLNFGVVSPPRLVSHTPQLDRVGRDLTAQARAGRFAAHVPRPTLLQELELDLCRSVRGATVLVGPGGCGKTALLEMLATHLLGREAPRELLGARLVEMAAAEVLSPGFEALIQELSGQHVLLILDEFHRPLSQGRSEGYAAIKHVLEAPDIRVLGTCTPESYNDSVGSESGLKRRLRVLDVPPTTRDETLAILRTRIPDWSQRLGVQVTDAALEAVWEAHSHVQWGTMPDLALDVLEEACLRARPLRAAVDRDIVASVLDRRR